MTAIIALTAVIVLLTLGQPIGRHRAPRVRSLRAPEQRLHLADGTVDDSPLENSSPWVLVRDGHRFRAVST